MAGQKQTRNSSGQPRGSNSPGRAESTSGRPRGSAARSGGTTAPRSATAGRSGAAAGSSQPRRPGQVDRKAPPAGQSRPPQGKARPAQSKATPGTSATEPRPAGAADAKSGAPRWLQLATLALSVFGLGVSVYLTIAHYTTAAVLACSDKGFVNCAKVTTSAQSVVFGIFPVAVLGLAFYVFMVAVNTPWAWGSTWAWRSKLPVVYWARLGSVVVGMVFVLYLVFAEIVQIGSICLWCTSVHVTTFALFVLLVFHASSRPGSASTAAR
jgi:uncharacterized membrane protein